MKYDTVGTNFTGSIFVPLQNRIAGRCTKSTKIISCNHWILKVGNCLTKYNTEL